MKRRIELRRWIKCGVIGTLALTLIISAAGCTSAEKELESSKVGETIKTEKQAERDGKYHEVTYVVTGIERDQAKVKARLEAYNLSGTNKRIAAVDSKDLEYCLVDYQVHFPKEFPQADFGITKTTLAFSIVSISGKDDIKVGNKNYKELKHVEDISQVPQGYDFYSGRTFKGTGVFLMPKGHKDYLIKEIPEKAGGKGNYIRGN